jgi:hypothetical protein
MISDKKKLSPLLLLLFLIIYIFCTSCNIKTSNTTNMDIPTKTQDISVSTLVPTKGLIQINTPNPTISPKQEAQLVTSLHETDCFLPCYLGITPGKSLLSEAEDKLLKLGGNFTGIYKREKDNTTTYTYTLFVGDDSTKYSIINSEEPVIYHHVDLTTDDNVVQIIEVGISSTTLRQKLREYWSLYTARSIFLKMGTPNSLYIDKQNGNLSLSGRTLKIEYPNIGVIIEIYGSEQDNNLCPENKATSSFIRLSLFNPGSNLSIYNDGRPLSSDENAWLPIEEALGLTVNEFYNQVVVKDSTCFPIK